MRRIAIALPISGFGEHEIARRDAFIRGLLPDGVEADLLTSPASPRFLDAAKHFAEAVDAAVEFYTGIDTDTGSFDQSTAISSALTLVGTVAVLKILSWGAKHI